MVKQAKQAHYTFTKKNAPFLPIHTEKLLIYSTVVPETRSRSIPFSFLRHGIRTRTLAQALVHTDTDLNGPM